MIIGKSNYKKFPTWLSLLYSTLFLSWELLYDRLLFKKPLNRTPSRRPILTTADMSKCNECRECVELCPDFALSLQSNELILDQMRCSNCEYCATVCEEEKISLDVISFRYLSSSDRIVNLSVAAKDAESDSSEFQ